MRCWCGCAGGVYHAIVAWVCAGSLASMDVMPRDGWTDVAAHKSDMVYRRAPADYVFYSHTDDSAKCHVTRECCAEVRNIQSLHMHVRRTYSYLLIARSLARYI